MNKIELKKGMKKREKRQKKDILIIELYISFNIFLPYHQLFLFLILLFIILLNCKIIIFSFNSNKFSFIILFNF